MDTEETQLLLNKQKFESCFERYIEECKNTPWLTEHEAYKFRFANWIHPRIDFETQNNEKIIQICKESQEQQYRTDSNEKGVNFITGIKRFKDDYITEVDIEVARELYKGKEPTEELLGKAVQTYPKLSIWLSIFFPERFYTYATNEISDSLTHLFDNNDIPKIGFKAFQTAQHLLQILGNKLRQKERKLIEVFRPIIEKDQIEDIDWVWITQDFNLFIL